MCSLPVERYRHTLEDEVEGRANEPAYGINKVDPPVYGEPALVDVENSSVEEKKAHFYREEARPVDDGGDPNVLIGECDSADDFVDVKQ